MEDDCFICLEEIGKKPIFIFGECGHYCHKKCFIEYEMYIKRNTFDNLNCPICRKKLVLIYNTQNKKLFCVFKRFITKQVIVYIYITLTVLSIFIIYGYLFMLYIKK